MDALCAVAKVAPSGVEARRRKSENLVIQLLGERGNLRDGEMRKLAIRISEVSTSRAAVNEDAKAEEQGKI
eukprot:scaffold1326_cov124-Pinguiococcus_pyrenoidosus.AAC.1